MNIRNELWGVIVNPYSGKRQLEKDWTTIFRVLKKAEIEFSEQLTAYPGHATEIAREMVEGGFRHLLIVGGDGTLNEVVNGIYTSSIEDKQNVTIALIPYGTGNDWARYWGITRKFTQLNRQLYERKTAQIDLGKVTYTANDGQKETRFFLNGAGWGFDGMVVRITNKIKRYLGGAAWVYSLSVLIALFKLRTYDMKLVGDDKTVEKSIFTIAMGNGCYSGGGLKQVPDANPCDGVFHVTALEGPKLKQIPSALKLLFSGRLPEHECAHSFVTTKFTVNCADKLYAETDGVEIDAQSPFEVEIVPNALHMLIL